MVGGFDEFLKMQGCKQSFHMFTEKKAETDQVACRHDWYQMGPSVVVCVYAKNVDKGQSRVAFGARSLEVSLVLPEGKRFDKQFALSQVCTTFADVI